jgi:hypothetical protein
VPTSVNKLAIDQILTVLLLIAGDPVATLKVELDSVGPLLVGPQLRGACLALDLHVGLSYGALVNKLLHKPQRRVKEGSEFYGCAIPGCGWLPAVPVS